MLKLTKFINCRDGGWTQSNLAYEAMQVTFTAFDRSSLAVITKQHTERLKKTKCIFLQFWSLGSPRSRCWPIWFPSSLADSCLLTMFSYGRDRVSSLGHQTYGVRVPSYDLTNLNGLSKEPVTKYSHTGGLELQHINAGGTQLSPYYFLHIPIQ